MVRINIISPGCLADQHLIAEYNEILMLIGYVSIYPIIRDVPSRYCLGKGHMIFFKDKLAYIRKRHELLKQEMRKRGFKPNRSVDLKGFSRKLINDWKPEKGDAAIIKKRLIEKISLKPGFYRYYGIKRSKDFFIKRLNMR